MTDQLSTAELAEIRSFVERYRVRTGIGKVGRERLSEPSAYGYPSGEIAVLLFRQLAGTEFGFGAWSELQDSSIRDQVLALVRSEAA